MSKSMSCIDSMCPAFPHPYSSHNQHWAAATEAGQGQRKICPATGRPICIQAGIWSIPIKRHLQSVSIQRPGSGRAPYLVENSMYDWVPWLLSRHPRCTSIPELVEGKCVKHCEAPLIFPSTSVESC